jgi:predicted RNA-binding Zn-ribbon protein involved in translation (DUF1610 family)
LLARGRQPGVASFSKEDDVTVSSSIAGEHIHFTCDTCGGAVEVRTFVYDTFIPQLEFKCPQCKTSAKLKIGNSHGVVGAGSN